MKRPLRIARVDLASPPPPRDAVESWLNLVMSMLHVPEAERRGVGEELESHLRERVRDLMVAGVGEAEAAGRAIHELGDAAALARRYQEAIKPSGRRHVMHAAAIGLASLAVGLGGAALLGNKQGVTPGQGEATSMQEARTSAEAKDFDAETNERAAPMLAAHPPGQIRASTFVPPEDEALARAAEISIEVRETTTWREVVEQVVRGGQSIKVRWEHFDEVGIDSASPIGLGMKNATLAGAVLAFNEAGGEQSVLGLGMQNGVLLMGPQAALDREDRELVSLDLTPLLERARGDEEAMEKVQQLIQSLVEPDSWRASGGDLGEMYVFGSKLFVKAPRRWMPRVRWVLNELLEDQAAAGLGIGKTPLVIRVVDGKVEVVGGSSRVLAEEIRVSADGSFEAAPEAGAWLNLRPTLIETPPRSE